MLDLATAQGRAAAREPALGADVLVENFRPGTVRKFGLDHEALSREHPASSAAR